MAATGTLRPHRILRQIFEVTHTAEDQTKSLWDTLRRLNEQQILPLMDSLCASRCDSDGVYRIERVELDLGTLPMDALESLAGERFERAFAQALQREMVPVDILDTDLEYVEHYLATGTVPWWSDAADTTRLSAALTRLMDGAPGGLRAILADACRSNQGLRRLITGLPLARLEPVLYAMLPDAPSAGTPQAMLAPRAWAAALLRPDGGLGSSPGMGLRLWWEVCLGLIHTSPATANAEWVARVLTGLAQRIGASSAALFAKVITHLPRVASDDAPGELDKVRRLLTSVPATFASATASAQPGDRGQIAALASILRDLRIEDQSLSRVSPQLLAAVDRLPAYLRPAVHRVLDRYRDSGPNDAAPAPTTEALAQQVQAILPRRPGEGARASTLVVESLHVTNAGLVLLWPFLEACFARLQLLQDRQFRDEAARQRAIALLQYMAGADPAPAEPLLPLNKLLCGLAPDDNFEMEEALSELECSECDALLSAVIAQTPVLNDMSLDGYRGSFLLRPGQLSAQGQHWLLRVERVTYDIVTDRFPWSVTTVKLPWMPFILQVEW